MKVAFATVVSMLCFPGFVTTVHASPPPVELGLVTEYQLGGLDTFVHGMTTGDYNEDGRGDVAVGLGAPLPPDIRFAPNIVLLFGDGGGGFQDRSELPLPPPIPFSIIEYMVSHDVDGDGHADLAALYRTGNPGSAATRVLLYLGDGTGDFSLGCDVPVGHTGGDGDQNIAFGDVDEDGNTDMVVSRRDDFRVTLFRGTADRCFGGGEDVAVVFRPDSVRLTDLTEDGHLDLVVGNEWYFPSQPAEIEVGGVLLPLVSVPLAVLGGDGAGGFHHVGQALFTPSGPYPPISFPPAFLDGPRWLFAGDLNNDSHLDLITATTRRGTWVFLGDGTGNLTVTASFLDNSVLLDVADVNLDGCQDIIGTKLRTDLQVFAGACDGTFLPPTLFLASTTAVPGITQVAFTFVQDFNADLAPDAVAYVQDSVLLGGGFTNLKTQLSVFLNRARPSNRHPRADAGDDQIVECSSSVGTPVVLNGSRSTDPDSIPGTNDGIAGFQWFEDNTLVATGEVVSVNLPVGVHTLTLEATDKGGLTGTDDVSVTILDRMPPTLSVSVTPSLLWPPNHRLVPVSPVFAVGDTCDPSPTVRFVYAVSNEVDNGLGDGDTANDIVADSTGQVFLRSERSGRGVGRSYTLTFTATDRSGNSTSATATVVVPHNRK